MHELLISILKKVAYAIAIGIILMALLISVSRLITPVLDDHRTDFEKWASDLLELPVNIAQVRVSWYQYQPEITLNEVTILNKETKNPIMQIKSLHIFFSLSQSLWQRKPVPSSVVISGVDIDLHQTKSGEISIQGFPSIGGFSNRPYENETKFADLMAWLSSHDHLALQNIDIRFTPYSGRKQFVTLNQLSLENQDESHTLEGKAILHQDIPTEIMLNIQWTGMSVDPNKIKANAYFYVSGLSLTQWAKEQEWMGWRIKQGLMSAKLWLSWNQGQFDKVQSIFQIYNLNLHSMTDQTDHVINRLSGNVGWKREGENQIFAGQDILIDFPKHLWPLTQFYVALSPDANNTLTPKIVKIGYTNISDIQPYIFSSPIQLSSELKKTLNELHLTGDMQDISINFGTPWTDWQQSSFQATINGLSFASRKSTPGVKNLSGMISWNNAKGDFVLNSKKSKFEYDSVFLQPIYLNQLQGSGTFYQNENKDWVLETPKLSVLNDDLAINVSGKITIPESTKTVVDLTANATMPRASHVTRYLPMPLFDSELVDWLNKAFLAGEVQSVHAELKGALSDFPFDHNNGTFLITANVKNIDLHYAPEWPNLKRIQGKVEFKGRGMTADVDSAELNGITVGQVHAVIPYLGEDKPQILEIQSEPIQSDFAKGLEFVHVTPLEKTIGKLFKDVQLSGSMSLKLGLTIPLKNPSDAKVSGDLMARNALFNAVPWNLSVDQLNGNLHFTEDSIAANNLQGKLFQKPITLHLETIHKTKKSSNVKVNLNTNISSTDLEKWLKLPLAQKANGSTQISGSMYFSFDGPIIVNLQSKLVGVAIDLPKPYGKKENESRDFTADLIIVEKKPLQAQFGYGNILNTALIMEKVKGEFNILAANILIGSGKASWPKSNGLYITANFDQLDWDQIKQYTEQSDQTSFANLTLQQINVRARLLNIFGQRLRDVQLQVVPKGNQWNIDVQSRGVSGRILAPNKMTQSGLIIADFNRLNLSRTNDTKPSSFNLRSIPAIDFNANNVVYNDMPLGKIKFKSTSNNGMKINLFTITSPHIKLQATGDWMQSGNTSMTRLKGNATTNNVSKLLSSFGFDVHNFIANQGQFDFNLSWRNSPFSPELATMNGDSQLEIGKGRIIDVGDTSGAKMDIGKMLSIFSLQSIPRRLTFDFSDVFQKGYSFDSLKGDFTLKNGDAQTTNTRFESPIARVAIHGRIGLLRKDYDFVLSVTPYITSSVPVAATLLTLNPLVGVAAFAVNKVVGTAVSQVTTYYYSVTGSWNNPVYKPI